jgi:WD40 repeat protein
MHNHTCSQAAMLARTLKVHTRHVTCVDFLGDSQHIVSGSYDGTIVISDARTCQVTCTITDRDVPVVCVAVSKDGTRLASGDRKGIIKVRTLKDGASPTELYTLKEHNDCLNALEFSPDDQKITSLSGDATLLVWSAQSGERLQTFTRHDDDELLCLAWSPDSKLVACAGIGNIISVVDAATGTQVRELKEGHSLDIVWCLSFGATSDVLYTGGSYDDFNYDISISEWKLAEGRAATVTRRLQGHTDEVMSISVSPCATWMASASVDRTVRVWNLAMGKQIRELKGHTGCVLCVKWSRDGNMIVGWSNDQAMRVWEVDAQVCSIHVVKISAFIFEFVSI